MRRYQKILLLVANLFIRTYLLTILMWGSCQPSSINYQLQSSILCQIGPSWISSLEEEEGVEERPISLTHKDYLK